MTYAFDKIDRRPEGKSYNGAVYVKLCTENITLVQASFT